MLLEQLQKLCQIIFQACLSLSIVRRLHKNFNKQNLKNSAVLKKKITKIKIFSKFIRSRDKFCDHHWIVD